MSDDIRAVKSGKRTSSAFRWILLLLVFVIAGFAFINSSFFSVTSVVIDGNQFISSEEICEIAQIEPRVNLFKIDVRKISERLHKDLRIEDVTIKRHFPTTLSLHITERQPLAYLPCSYGFIQVDKQGLVMVSQKTIKNLNVPMITGVKAQEAFIGDRLEQPQIKQALTLLQCLDSNTLKELSEINMNQPDNVILYTVGNIKVRLGSVEHMTEKMRMFTNALQEINQNRLNVEYLDFSYDTPVMKFRGNK